MLGLVLAVIRENGMNSLSLGVLVWVVWFQAQAAERQADQWRETVKEVTLELKTQREQRMQSLGETNLMVVRIEGTLKNIQDVMTDLKREVGVTPRSQQPERKQ
mgnify:FL=1